MPELVGFTRDAGVDSLQGFDMRAMCSGELPHSPRLKRTKSLESNSRKKYQFEILVNFSYVATI
jgi:hypothetical protein